MNSELIERDDCQLSSFFLIPFLLTKLRGFGHVGEEPAVILQIDNVHGWLRQESLTTLININHKVTLSRDFRLLGFFVNQFQLSPKPLSIPIGPFWIFSKICGDIRSSRCTTGVADTGGKWKNLQSVDTGGKFATGIVDTVAKLVAKFAAGVVDAGGNFATGVVVTVKHLDLWISPRIFEKFETVLMGYSGDEGKLLSY